jgi:hypothetical protein
LTLVILFGILKIHKEDMKIKDLNFYFGGLYLFNEEFHLVGKKCSICKNNIRFKTSGMCVWCFHHGKHSIPPKTATDEKFEIYWG